MVFYQYQKITIIRTTRPRQPDLNQELQFLGNSLGLFNLRDKDKSQFRIFIELLKSTKKGVQMSSDELAERLGLSRGTVVHHVNKLMEAGIVVNMHNKYLLRVENLTMLIEELEKDIQRNLEDLRTVAADVDKRLA
ncbi:winged helix-turn-helix transcriptional regulator [Candidatus Woesearchaeota archaeon]|nr:winged helix-turn-helix transcriptional regulator [Candidatus Woesearchaeota archaeon]